VGIWGGSYDNGPAETVIGLYKTEVIDRNVLSAGPIARPSLVVGNGHSQDLVFTRSVVEAERESVE
jgi:hypothetical protein